MMTLRVSSISSSCVDAVVARVTTVDVESGALVMAAWRVEGAKPDTRGARDRRRGMKFFMVDDDGQEGRACAVFC